jgi:hypothetical protein
MAVFSYVPVLILPKRYNAVTIDMELMTILNNKPTTSCEGIYIILLYVLILERYPQRL